MRRNGKLRIGHAGILAILFLGLAARGASPRVTELEQVLTRAGAADKPGLLVQLSAAIEADDTSRAWEYAQQARRESVTPEDEIRADTRLAALQRRRGSYPEAMALAQAALARAENLGNDTLRAELLLVIANTYDSLADFPAALEIFRTLIPLAEAGGDPAFLSRVYTTLGTTYADAEQLDRARQACLTALDYATKARDQRMVASLLNNLGNVAMETDNAPLARDYHEKALALRLSLGGDTRGIADSNQNLAHVSIMEDKPADALPYLDRAIPLYVSLGLKRNLANAQVAYANALRLLGRLDEVPAHLDSARALAEELNSPTVLVRVYRAAALFHEARGDLRQALDFERKLANATDAAIGEKSRQRLDTLQARFDAERRQHEIDVLHRDHQLQQAELTAVRWQRYSLAVVLVGVVALAIAIISRQRLKHRAEKRILAETRAGRTAAEAANALKTRLLHVTSHDIRGPLGNILHMAEELRAEFPRDQPEVRLDVIKHEAENVMSFAQDILDSAALEIGALTLHPAPLDLAEVVRTVLGRMQWRAELKQQTLEFAPDSRDAGLIEGDAARLNQVVANLVSNALKYSPARKRIRLQLGRADRVVRLSVADEGPGITPEDQARLFTPFARLGNRPQGGESSHGLGLSIAHDLVRLHGGRLLVESVPGRGSTFTMEIPTAVTAPAASPRP